MGPHSSTAEIEAFIAECTERLRGPLSDVERALIVADRKDARKELEKRALEKREFTTP